MEEALSSSETAVHTRATRRNIPEDTILQTCMIFIEVSVEYTASIQQKDRALLYIDHLAQEPTLKLGLFLSPKRKGVCPELHGPTLQEITPFLVTGYGNFSSSTSFITFLK
jgi:hypothetical protein